MLRILRIVGDGSIETLKLEGKLLNPWVEELRRAYTLAAAPSGRARLDLSALTFADEAGAGLLRELIGGGAEVGACSSYMAALLQLQA